VARGQARQAHKETTDMKAPERMQPASLADYLEVMTRSVFEPGLNWSVVEAKWPGISAAFEGFDPEAVAGLTPADVERLMGDPGIIRNRKKIEATIHNAGEMLNVEREHGSFKRYLGSAGSFGATVADMRRRFKFLGEMGAYRFLYVVGEPVPAHEDWMAAHAASARRR
jgi:DNA-3-methyladenine glycosylase I